MKPCVYFPQINCTITGWYGQMLTNEACPFLPPYSTSLYPKAEGRVLPAVIQKEVTQCSTVNFKIRLSQSMAEVTALGEKGFGGINRSNS